jgi:hypothetical protein
VLSPTSPQRTFRYAIRSGADPVTAGSLNRWTLCSTQEPCINKLRLGAGWNGNNARAGNVSSSCVFYGPLATSAVLKLYDGDATTMQPDGCVVVGSQYQTPTP